MVTAKQLLTATNILKNAGCTDVFLFGSQATGRAHAGSDVDLGIFMVSVVVVFISVSSILNLVFHVAFHVYFM